MNTTVVSTYVTCRVCSKEFPRRASHCPNCATPNRPPARTPGAEQSCFRCGQRLSRKSNICGECGHAH
ncbi:MAG: zinc ribbon domain-containing protein [Phycisphaeraceae bacterium]|nr:zinc ribbon domain-containing protein [Phycisphaeraceae bacterium]